MGAYDRDEVGYRLPPDLEITPTAAAASAAVGSKDSYTKKIKIPLIKNKEYRFFFTYLHEDPETKEIKESDRSPVWKETFTIPNLTKAVKNLTLTPGSQSYGVKFDLDPLSEQEDVVIFESLTSNFATQTIVYTGTSTNVSILTTGPNAFAPRWVKVRSRDKWDDLNISEATAGPVTPFSADVDTTYTVENPASSSASASIDPKDLSGFSLVSTISWAQSTNVKTAGYAIRWSTDNPATVTNPLWEYASVSGITTTSFTATGLIPNTTYYYQVASTTPYDVVSWTGAASGTFIASDADGTAAGALARLKSFIAIGGASQDLFKIGTGISQSINLNTDPLVSPTLTAGTYHGIILNKSTTNVGNNFWLTTGQFRVGNPTEFMYWNGTNLYLTGNVNATGGKFTGNVQLAIPAGATTSGTLFAGANPTSGARVRFSSEGIFAYDATSTDNATGQTFSLVQSTGRLNANLGTVGGWTLATTGFSSSNTKIENDGNITLGNQVGSIYPIVRLSATDDFRLWVGSNSSSTAKFRVSKEGILYAEGAVIGLGAGSTIDGYATTSSLNNYTLTTTTTAINSRLQTVEGAYVTNTTLNTNIATKNAIFVQDGQPTATKVGDVWIDTDEGNILKTWTGSTWTTRTNSTYATTTALNTKLEAGGYAISTASNQITNITSNGIFITPGTFKISNTNETAPTTGSYVLLNSAGLTAYDGTKTTFAISSSGSASFSGNLSAAGGTFEGRLFVNNDTGYIDTAGTKSVNGIGVTSLVVKALGFRSTDDSGWTSTCYPWTEGLFSLGSTQYSWYRLYMEDDVYFANGTTYKIEQNGDAFLNGYAVSGGFGVYSHWAPRSDNTYDLGGWSLSSTGIQQNKRWRQIYSNNSTITTSDSRLKTDISDSELGLNFINKLRPVTYRWIEGSKEPVLVDKEVKHIGIDGVSVEKTDIVKTQKISGQDEDGNDIYETVSIPGKRRHAGFLAQEVKQVLDELEVEDFGGWVSDNIEDPEAIQSLRYEQFVAPLTKAVQELSDMVESLQQEINILKGI
jgi:hypothetical protein